LEPASICYWQFAVRSRARPASAPYLAHRSKVRTCYISCVSEYGHRGLEFAGVNKNIYQQPDLSSHVTLGSKRPRPQMGRRSLLSRDGAIIAVVVLAVAAVLAWLSARDFPLGVHVIEPIKVWSVLMGPRNFFHPLLMIHLARGANALVGLTDPQSVVELGRAFAAVAGGILIVATFVLGRLVLPAWVAFAAAAATLATPLVTTHARFFKEDIFLAPFIVLALGALVAVLRTPTLGRTIALGAVIGLAGGSKYSGLLLLPYALAVMIFFASRERIGARLTQAGIVALTAGCVFALIEAPALFAIRDFFAGVRHESLNAIEPKIIVHPITLTWGTFHLRESLWPGLGPLLTVLGVVGLTTPFFASPKHRQPLAIIAGFAFVWYLAHEISTHKPTPDFARFMVPLVPLLTILGAAFINEWAEQYRAGAGVAASIMVLLAAAIPACWLSLSINVGAYDDSRRLLPGIMANAPGRLVADDYQRNYPAVLPFKGWNFGWPDPLPTAADTTIFVITSFDYDRFKRWGALPHQPIRTRALAQFFAQALALPRIDVSNNRPSSGFFNPTTTIIAMDGNAERLLPIAEMIARVAPSLVVRWNGPRPTPHLEQRDPD
jgi:hypothetical protein